MVIFAPKAARRAAHAIEQPRTTKHMQPLMDHSNAPKLEPDEGKLSTPRQRLLAAVDLDGVIETEPRSPVQEGTPAWRTPARLAAALKDDDNEVDEVAVAQALARLQAKLREEQTSKAAPPPPPENLEAAIAAHAASSVSLDAEEADVKQTFLFHHDPSHNDEKMDEIAKEAAAVREGVRPAIEGEEIEL